MTTKNIQRTLYGYWRSSASYRVRIALNLKDLHYIHRGLNLILGEQRSAEFLTKNPQGLIPLLVETSGNHAFSLSQSLAILDYLEERHPNRPLLPSNPQEKAKIRAAAQVIACDVHPLDNLRVLDYLENTLGASADHKMTWYRHWVDLGFSTLEMQLPILLNGNPFSLGEYPGYLEALLVPQVYNAKRFGCSLEKFPTIVAINDACLNLPPFINASPEKQPDAQ